MQAAIDSFSNSADISVNPVKAADVFTTVQRGDHIDAQNKMNQELGSLKSNNSTSTLSENKVEHEYSNFKP